VSETFDSQSEAIWNKFKMTIGECLSYLTSEDARNSVEAVSLESSLLDAIFEIDSAPDMVDPGAGYLVSAEEGGAYSGGVLPTLTKMGKLQRIRLLKLALFGGQYTQDTGDVIDITGMFDSLEELPLEGE